MPFRGDTLTATTLKEFLSCRTQKQAAEQLGVNQSAVSQMLAANRDIRIKLAKDGAVIEIYEVKPIGCKSAQVA